MAYPAGGGAPESPADGRVPSDRAVNAWLLVAGAVACVLGLVALAGSVHGALAAAGIFSVVCSFVPSKAGHVATFSAVAVAAMCVVVAPSGGALLFAGLVLGCTVLGRTTAALVPSLDLLTTAFSSERLDRESVLLDERARTELTRARRYERPLSVVAVQVEGRGKRGAREAASAGHALTRELRTTDVVGVTEAGYAIAILPETGHDVVADLLSRLAASVLETGTRGSIGLATFPDDAVTWGELQRAATRRAVPLTATVGPSSVEYAPAQLKEQRVHG